MDNFDKFYNKALRFLSFRPRSEKEIRDYFKVKSQKSKVKIDEKIIESIIKKLKEQKFINDIEFVKWWIEGRIKYKPRAMRIIKQELKAKGISNEVIDSAISNFQFLISNDMEMAIELAEKRMPRYKNETPKKVYDKLGRFLASKGFGYDTIKKVIDQVLEK